MIVEFQVGYVHGEQPDKAWESKRSIDMRWVSSARPYMVGLTPDTHEDVTMVTLAGSDERHAFVVRSTYSRFMELWVQAQGE